MRCWISWRGRCGHLSFSDLLTMLSGTGEWFIASPLIALFLFAVALAVGSVLMHVLPSFSD